jgi:hypothetical protein
MKTVIALLALSLAGAGTFVAASFNPQDQDKGAHDMQPDKPGTEHAVLKMFEGTWDTQCSMTDATGKVTKSAGSETSKLGLGGLWLCCEYSGDMMGQKFEGKCVTGYDQRQKRFVEVWVDSMSSGTNLDTGDWDAATKTMTMHGKCPKTGEAMTRTSKFTDNDHYTMTFSGKGQDGRDGEQMKIEFTRRK